MSEAIGAVLMAVTFVATAFLCFWGGLKHGRLSAARDINQQSLDTGYRHSDDFRQGLYLAVRVAMHGPRIERRIPGDPATDTGGEAT